MTVIAVTQVLVISAVLVIFLIIIGLEIMYGEKLSSYLRQRRNKRVK